ncbi:MAG TPA: sulfatase-like hydrolase/transferase [Thermoanaerobaculia bacterium]|nr:sulfatase-like hydrolase/transferase [Thermoanaerobaculia bacterium]
MLRRGLAALFFALLACSPRHETPAGAPSEYAPVILISVDTLRADHLPSYGYRAIATPSIDALAADGLLFANAWSHCPMTLPSHLTMLTGLLPTEHGVRNNLGFRFDAAKHPTIASLLHAHGYATGAAVSSYVLRGDTGLREAFDWYDDELDAGSGSTFADYQRRGDVTVARAEEWVTGKNAQPFFLFLHLYEPHVPYEPSYDGEIVKSDALVGRFVQFLKSRGIYDRAIIVFTSDHGEGLGDHGEQQHSILLYREAIQVPLIVKLPGSDRHGERIASTAALVDIAPTLASLTGVELRASAAAASLLALPKSREVYGETIYPYLQLGWSDLRSMLNDHYHYIDGPRPELYALDDARETQNVVNSERRVAADFRAKLAKYPAANAVAPIIDPEAAAKLAAIGYVGSVASRPDPRTLPNPRDSLGALDEMQQAFRLADQRQYAPAIAQLRAVVTKNPRLTDAWTRLAQLYTDVGDVNAAVGAYKNAIASAGVFSPEIALMLGNLYVQAGRAAEAEEVAGVAADASPAAATTLRARIAIARNDFASAERFARALTEGANATAADFVLLGEVLNARGDYAGALKAADAASSRAAAAGKPSVYGLEAVRADAFARTDRANEAIAAYEKEIAAFPVNRLAYSRLALLYYLTGDRAKYEATLARLLRANPTPLARDLVAQTRAALGDRRK